MKEAEFELDHDGNKYLVLVEFATKNVNENFEGKLDGYVLSFEIGHQEIDFENWDILSCINEDNESVDPEYVPGLMSEIINFLRNFEF